MNPRASRLAAIVVLGMMLLAHDVHDDPARPCTFFGGVWSVALSPRQIGQVMAYAHER